MSGEVVVDGEAALCVERLYCSRLNQRQSPSTNYCHLGLHLSPSILKLLCSWQSCPLVQVLRTNSTHQTTDPTQPNHRKVKTLYPKTNTTHNPTELHTTNNKPSGTRGGAILGTLFHKNIMTASKTPVNKHDNCQ